MANLQSLKDRFKDIKDDVPEESDIEQIMSQEAKERVDPTPSEPVEFPNVLSLATEEFEDVTESEEEPLPEVTVEVSSNRSGEKASVPERPPLPEKEELLPATESDDFPADHPEIDPLEEKKESAKDGTRPDTVAPKVEEPSATKPAPAKKTRQPRGVPRAAVAEKPEVKVDPKPTAAPELLFFKEISAKIIAEAKESVKPDGIDSDLYWDRILDIIENH